VCETSESREARARAANAIVRHMIQEKQMEPRTVLRLLENPNREVQFVLLEALQLDTSCIASICRGVGNKELDPMAHHFRTPGADALRFLVRQSFVNVTKMLDHDDRAIRLGGVLLVMYCETDDQQREAVRHLRRIRSREHDLKLHEHIERALKQFENVAVPELA
jgi:hypothetical protein